MGTHSVLDHEDDKFLLGVEVRTNSQDDVLARELPLHQGCLHHETNQNGGMDGKC